MRYALIESNFIVAIHELDFTPEDTGRTKFIPTAEHGVGDFWDGVAFVNVNNHPSTISGTTISADGFSTVAIFDVPYKSKIVIDNHYVVPVEDIEDTDFEFSADFPGTYSIRVESYPYLPKEFTVEAV